MTQEFRKRIVEAGLASMTDKVSHHHYEAAYSRHLENFSSLQGFAMAEIGYGSGSGVNFWLDLFPNRHVYCIDRDHEGSGNRYDLIQGDQSSIQSLAHAIEQIRHPIDLIVDDGSHLPAHQLLTFSYLFQELLSKGGVYIVEDIETSYWRRGSIYGYSFNYGLHDPWSTIEAFKIALDYVNRHFLSSEDKSLIEYRLMSIGLDPSAVGEIESIEFSQNCLIIRKHSTEARPDQGYAYSDFVSRS